MTLTRGLAVTLLRAVERHSAAEAQTWAAAMLSELDAIDSDWQALRWSLGSIGAICRRFGWLFLFRKSSEEEQKMNDLGKKAVGLVEGIGIAFGLVLLGLGLLWAGFLMFPSSGIDRAEWTHVLVVVVIPEILFVLLAMQQWRKRRPIAVGILLSGLVLATHVIVHFANRGTF